MLEIDAAIAGKREYILYDEIAFEYFLLGLVKF